ncbi:SDR family oxidoreductase [Luteibaculum oceani]|uniref:SDR family oxidoreductase n=1 Tax=Luteibaculum oceani TaxID=1294296 RepID=A0A5C6VKI9_9FLAO|nr:SDR family oxidoreductase [Luteibaculum oceani]TXC85221.1 SDR family oxidoreductase [Luteibaculum oceani]
MKILLTGATGYIGKRLLPLLLEEGHEVICMARDRNRFQAPRGYEDSIEIYEADLLKAETLKNNIKADIAYYLVHSMSSSTENFDELEAQAAKNFAQWSSYIGIKQVIYLSGLANADELSKHLSSRKQVEEILSRGTYSLTTLRAGIIVGSGSASFEIIRDLVEKLPIMIAPKWLNTRCQPIGIADVLSFLFGCLNQSETFNKTFDIGGADVLTYKEMLLGYAKVRGLKRYIGIVPVMTPRLSSYWLYFVTSTSYKLAVSLVDSMRVEVICKEERLKDILNITPRTYEASLRRTFDKIDQNIVVSSWKDSLNSGPFKQDIANYIEVPTNGCLFDKRQKPVISEAQTLEKIWSIGGKNGWYAGNFLWRIRGFVDKIFGGVGLRRGRTHPTKIANGDALDFWRVILADKEKKRLLLFAEMKVPGDAWLEFRIENGILYQEATFRPLGVMGRLYWWAVSPLHGYVFQGMLNKLAQ